MTGRHDLLPHMMAASLPRVLVALRAILEELRVEFLSWEGQGGPDSDEQSGVRVSFLDRSDRLASFRDQLRVWRGYSLTPEQVRVLEEAEGLLEEAECFNFRLTALAGESGFYPGL